MVQYIKNVLKNNSAKVLLLVTLLAVADYFTLYSLISKVSTVFDSGFFSVLITLVVAVALEVTPVVMANHLNYWQCTENEYAKRKNRLIFILTTIGFFALFALTFWLRMVVIDDGASTDILSSLSNSSIAIETSEASEDGREYFKIFLGISPLITSLLAFVLAYNDNPIKKKLRDKEAEYSKLCKDIRFDEEDISLIDDKLSSYSDDDVKLYVAYNILEVESLRRECKVIARSKLADVLDDPISRARIEDSIEELMGKDKLDENPFNMEVLKIQNHNVKLLNA